MNTHTFLYCPKCKGDLKQESEHLLICTNCSFHFYQNPKGATGAILRNEHGDVLLYRRISETGSNKWDVLGGFIDLDESLEQSLERELREELSIQATNIQYFKSYPDTYLYQNIEYKTLVFMMTASYTGEFKKNEEIGELRWFKPNEIPYDEIAFESVAQGLRDYFRLNNR